MAAAAAANLAGRPGVRVVFIGDPGTGKSSLVVAVATEQFPENVPKVMPHTRLPAGYFPDRAPITIIDTSSSPEQKPKQNSLEQTMAPIMQSFREIETCIECSALRQIQWVIRLTRTAPRRQERVMELGRTSRRQECVMELGRTAQ